MVSIPLEWTISLKGGKQVKTTLAELNSGVHGLKRGTEEYNKALARGSTAALRSANIGKYQNNIYLAQHPNLLRISRSLSTVTSISRSLLTITNALNLAKISGQGFDRVLYENQKEENKLRRAIADEMSKPTPNMEKVNEMQQDLNALLAETKQYQKDVADQDFQNLITNIGSVGTAVGTLTLAAIKLLGRFNLINKAVAKLPPGLLPPGTVKTPSGFIGPVKPGTIGGGAPGANAGGMGLIGGVGIGIAVMEWFLDHVGVKKQSGTTPKTSFKTLDDMMKELFESTQAYGETYNPIQGPIQDTGIRPIMGGITPVEIKKPEVLASAISNNINFKDLVSTIEDSSKVMIEGNSILEDYYRYREEFDPWDQSARERMRQETQRLAEKINKTIISTDSLTNKLGNIQVTVKVSTKSGRPLGAFGSVGGNIIAQSPNDNIWGAGQFLGTNGKLYKDQREAYLNGAWPVAAANGFNGVVNGPTLFLAGEAGPEHVNITPNGKSSGGNTIIINVAGSILSEKNLYRIVDRYQKQDLKSRGFTGFG